MFKFLLEDHKFIKILRSLDFTPPQPPHFTIGLAKQSSDYVDAAQLLHDSYVRRGLPVRENERLRVLPHIMPPSTSVIVAKSMAAVVGTATVIQRNPLGFPVQNILDPDVYHKFEDDAQGPIAEISSLAVAPEYVGKPASVFFPLAAYLYRYCHEFLRVDKVMIAVQPGLVDFYRAIFGFQIIGEPRPRPLATSGGIEAVALGGSVTEFENWVMTKLARSPKAEELRLMLLEVAKTDPNCYFPNRDFSRSFDQPKSAALIEDLFLKQTAMMSTIEPKQRSALAQMYPQTDDYRWVFQVDPRTDTRKARRFDVNLPTQVFTQAETSSRGLILDVSELGMRLQLNKSEEPLKVDDEVMVAVSLSKTSDVSLKTKIVWTKEKERTYGLELLEKDSAYLQYIRWLKQT